MKILDAWLTPGKEHGRPGNKINPEGICVHYVGNPKSDAAGNSNYFESGAGGRYVSAHYIVDLDGTVLRLIPENEQANHAGKYYGPPGTGAMANTNNIRYIGIECCHPTAEGKFNPPTMAALIELCADICKRHGFDPREDIKRHYDITGKMCPLYYVKNPDGWGSFITSVAFVMSKDDPALKIINAMSAAGVQFDRDVWTAVLSGKQSAPEGSVPVLMARVMAARGDVPAEDLIQILSVALKI